MRPTPNPHPAKQSRPRVRLIEVVNLLLVVAVSVSFNILEIVRTFRNDSSGNGKVWIFQLCLWLVLVLVGFGIAAPT